MAIACCELALRGFKIASGEPMSLWFALIGASASGKSSAILMADDFIHDVWTEANSTPASDPWVQASGSVSGLMSSIQEHFVATRGTTVCMLYEHEFSSLFNTREAVPEFLCNLADGATIQRNLRELQKTPRNAQRLDRVYLPATSALFATTEPAISAVWTDAMRHGGLYSRVWWIKPQIDPARLHMKRLSFDQDYEQALLSWVGWIAGMNLHEGSTIEISDEAWSFLDREMFRPMADKYSEDDDMAPTRLRACTKAQVVASIFATLSGRIVVQEADMRLAVAFMRMLLGHSDLMRGLGSSAVVRLVARAKRLVVATGETGMSRREVYRALHCDKVTLTIVLDTLIDQAEIFEDKSQVPSRYLACDTERGKAVAATRAARGFHVDGLAEVIDLRRGRRAE
jgi:hypothetical protein